MPDDYKEDNYTPWFTHKDKEGKKISIHIPNLFENVEKDHKRISELKIRYENLVHYKIWDLHLNLHKTRFNNIEEVLREHYKQRIRKSDWAIESIISGREDDMVKYIKDDTEFYKKQLGKLDQKDGDSPRIKAFKKAGLNVVSGPYEVMEFFKKDGEISDVTLRKGEALKESHGTHESDSIPSKCSICNDTGINIHIERDNTGILNREVEYPCQCQKEPTEDVLLEENMIQYKGTVYNPEAYRIVLKADLFMLRDGIISKKEFLEKYLSKKEVDNDSNE